jgi:hypothetical protein
MVRQSVDAATRLPQAVKSQPSSADVPMPSQLEARLRAHLKKHDGKSELLFVNRRGRPFSANKLREKQLHPLLVKLGIPRGGFHSMRHGAASQSLFVNSSAVISSRPLCPANSRSARRRNVRASVSLKRRFSNSRKMRIFAEGTAQAFLATTIAIFPSSFFVF